MILNLNQIKQQTNILITLKNNILIDCDYKAQEDVLFVNNSKETKMIEFYNDNTRERDGHSYVAKLCFPDKLKDILEEEVKAKLIKCEDVGNPDLHFKKLRELGDQLIQNPKYDNLNNFVSALANKKRLVIINIIKEKDRCVCELEVILKKSQSSISHHLRILEDAGLIRGWKKGKFTYYGIEKGNFEMNLKNLIENLNLEKVN